MTRICIALLGFISVFAISCSNHRHEILSPEKMIDVLTDMHIADALGADYDLRKSNIRFDSTTIYTNLFKKHQVSKAQLDSSMVFYSQQPELFMQMYDEVFARLSKQDEEINQLTRQFVPQNMEVIYGLDKNFFVVGDSSDYLDPITIPIDSVGRFFIQVNLRIHLNDSSQNPALVAYFHKDSLDSNLDSRIYFPKYPVFKSNYNREFNMYSELKDSTYKFLTLIIPETSNPDRYFFKNSQVSVIKVYRTKKDAT